MSNIINPYRFVTAGGGGGGGGGSPPEFSNDYSGGFSSSSLYDTRTGSPWAVGTGAFSVTFWCYINNSTSGGAGMVEFRSSAAYADGFTIYMGDAGDSSIINGFYCTIAASVTGWVADSSWMTETWHHVAVTRSVTGALYIYVDGSSVWGVTAGYSLGISGASAYGLRVGYDPYTPGNYLDGYMDEIGFFNAALSSGQVYDMASTPTDLSSYSSLVAWYRFENDSDLGEDSEGSYDLANANASVTRSGEVPA